MLSFHKMVFVASSKHPLVILALAIFFFAFALSNVGRSLRDLLSSSHASEVRGVRAPSVASVVWPLPLPQAPPLFPGAGCDEFQQSLTGPVDQLLLHRVAVHGPIPIDELYLLSNAPEHPLAIQEAMTRTEAMMAAAYKHILLNPMWASVPNAVVEVGVHGGWFAALAHKYGRHRVVGFDMQPQCTNVARCTLHVNGAGGVHPIVLNRYVSHGSATLDVSASSCGGGLGVGNRARGEVAVQPVHLGRFFMDPASLTAAALDPDFEVPILKSDTEGFEGVVLETALPILRKIHNVLLEVFGVRWKTHGIHEDRVIAVFRCLHAAGMNEMVELPRRDIDYAAPGDIDLAHPPPERVHRTWEQWRAHFDLILAAKNGVTNPNLWLRWGSDQDRRRLDLSRIPECREPLAQSTYNAPG
jgi:hypothetical protein